MQMLRAFNYFQAISEYQQYHQYQHFPLNTIKYSSKKNKFIWLAGTVGTQWHSQREKTSIEYRQINDKGSVYGGKEALFQRVIPPSYTEQRHEVPADVAKCLLAINNGGDHE
mgnify:CR=1 FL=1